MAPSEPRPKRTNLIEKIEIVRHRRDTEEQSTISTLEDTNPLQALAELVDRIEHLEELTRAPSIGHQRDSSELSAQGEGRYMHRMEEYLELFLKQSTVLKKLLSKLH